MENHWIKSVQELKDFVERNNIKMGENSRLTKPDYQAAIKSYLYSLASKSIIPCEWLLLVGSKKENRRPSVLGAIFSTLHQYRIRMGKSVSVKCVKCSKGTKTNRDCARDAEDQS